MRFDSIYLFFYEINITSNTKIEGIYSAISSKFGDDVLIDKEAMVLYITDAFVNHLQKTLSNMEFWGMAYILTVLKETGLIKLSSKSTRLLNKDSRNYSDNDRNFLNQEFISQLQLK